MRRARFNPKLTEFNAFSYFKLEAGGAVSVGPGPNTPPDCEPSRQPVTASILVGNEDPDQHKALVSCLMVTQDRFQQARLAIQCFRRQTWRRRELVIVDTSKMDDLARWVASLNDPSIRFVFMPGCMDRLGDLRNRSVEIAGGQFVAQWDDDDLSHPVRLQAQMALMSATDARASMLMREIVWIPHRYRLAIARRRAHENTLICEKAIMPKYPGVAKLEDTPLVLSLLQTRTVALLDLPELYVYVAHGANTWDDEHMEGIWHHSTDRFVFHTYDSALAQLSRCYPIAAYKKLLSSPTTR